MLISFDFRSDEWSEQNEQKLACCAQGQFSGVSIRILGVAMKRLAIGAFVENFFRKILLISVVDSIPDDAGPSENITGCIVGNLIR